LVSLCVTILGLEIVTLGYRPKSYRHTMILVKIFVTSILLRASAYFISEYSVGADPWAHAEYIRNYLSFGSLQVVSYPPGTGVSNEYVQYPLMHLYTVITSLVGNLGVHPAMF